MGITYKNSGVDIEGGEKALDRIKPLLKSTFSTDVLKDVGLFGGFFKLDTHRYKEPVLVSSVDGVGTKLKIAFSAGKHDTVGEDLVNHCVNDIAVSGAVPLFFMDYYATGKLDRDQFEGVIKGFVRGCKNNNCALTGGETAEMPGMYNDGEYDIAGMIVGIVDREDIIDGSKIKPGDTLIGVPSQGLHTNGYSLARSVLLKHYDLETYIPELECTLSEELLRIHPSYLKIIRELNDKHSPHGFAHITGGGITGNTNRIIPDNMKIEIDWNGWEMPPIFQLIRRLGSVSPEEMQKTFNLGIGLVVVAAQDETNSILQTIAKFGTNPIVIGEIKPQ